MTSLFVSQAHVLAMLEVVIVSRSCVPATWRDLSRMIPCTHQVPMGDLVNAGQTAGLQDRTSTYHL